MHLVFRPSGIANEHSNSSDESVVNEGTFVFHKTPKVSIRMTIPKIIPLRVSKIQPPKFSIIYISHLHLMYAPSEQGGVYQPVNGCVYLDRAMAFYGLKVTLQSNAIHVPLFVIEVTNLYVPS